MNFVDYCLRTKNYSSIKILKDYVNTFSKNSNNITKKKIIGASLGLTGLTGLGLAGKKLYDKTKETETHSEPTHYEVSQPVSDNTEVHDEQDQYQIQSNDSMSKLLQDLNEEFKDTDGISIEYR